MNPKTVYKFREPSKQVIDNLKEGQLWFSLPKLLNDPFDCKIVGYYKGTPDEWKQWLERQPLSPAEKKVTWDRLVSTDFDGSHSIINRQSGGLRVLSLTEVNDSVLMWSHYALKHTGFCYGFNTVRAGDSLGLLFMEKDVLVTAPGVMKGYLSMFPVDYQIAMPEPFNFVTEKNTGRLMEFALRKHPDWVYEKERRIVVFKNMINTQAVKYEKEILCEVIFGYMATEKTIEDVNQALRLNFPNSGKNVLRKQAVPIKGQYAVKIVDL